MKGLEEPEDFRSEEPDGPRYASRRISLGEQRSDLSFRIGEARCHGDLRSGLTHAFDGSQAAARSGGRVKVRVLLIILSMSVGEIACESGERERALEPVNEMDAGPVDTGASVDDAGAEAVVTPARAACSDRSECRVTWSSALAYPTVVDHHVSFAHTSSAGAFVYVAGGIRSANDTPVEIYPAVRRARIEDGPTLGAWETAGDLPQPLGYHALATSEDHVYVIGGISIDAHGGFLSAATWVGDFDDRGMMHWRLGASLDRPFGHATATIVRGRIVLAGGLGGEHHLPQTTVMTASLQSDGRNGAWHEVASLPLPRSHHAAIAHRDRVYLIGGMDANNEPLPDVLRSVHDDAGEVIGWEVAGHIDDPPWTHSAFVRGEWVFVIGGGQGGYNHEVFVDRVRRAHLEEDGSIGSFEDVEMPLPMARAHVHQTPSSGAFVFSVGGRRWQGDVRETISDAFIGNFATP